MLVAVSWLTKRTWSRLMACWPPLPPVKKKFAIVGRSYRSSIRPRSEQGVHGFHGPLPNLTFYEPHFRECADEKKGGCLRQRPHRARTMKITTSDTIRLLFACP